MSTVVLALIALVVLALVLLLGTGRIGSVTSTTPPSTSGLVQAAA